MLNASFRQKICPILLQIFGRTLFLTSVQSFAISNRHHGWRIPRMWPSSPESTSSKLCSFKKDQHSPTTIIANTGIFDPFDDSSQFTGPFSQETSSRNTPRSKSATLAPFLFSAALFPLPSLASDLYNPETFRPVCSTSDSLYRVLQSTALTVVGPENYEEYGPLIAGGLLRVRLELCVVESYFNEAIGPFIEKNGYAWILPIHETVETFVAGTIFAFATTFILVGSTKIVTVIVTYLDIFLGGPLRLFGGYFFDRARGKPVTIDVGFGFFKTRLVGPGDPKKEEAEENIWESLGDVETKSIPSVLATGGIKAVGEASRILRETTEAVDLFVGRYLTVLATGYIGIKFLHFKIFPDFPPF